MRKKKKGKEDCKTNYELYLYKVNSFEIQTCIIYLFHGPKVPRIQVLSACPLVGLPVCLPVPVFVSLVCPRVLQSVLKSVCLSLAGHRESGEGLWLHKHSIRDAEPQRVSPLNAKKDYIMSPR